MDAQFNSYNTADQTKLEEWYSNPVVKFGFNLVKDNSTKVWEQLFSDQFKSESEDEERYLKELSEVVNLQKKSAPEQTFLKYCNLSNFEGF